MRLLGLMFAVFLALPAFAGFQAYNGTTDLKVFNKVKCSTGMSCSKVGDQLVMVTSGLGLRAQVASTTTSLTAAQCGSTIVSDSADVVTLPEASTVLGCRYTFVCAFAGNMDVNPADGTDTIGAVMSITGTNTTTVLAPSAGDAIRCGAIGASITLEAVGANLWASIGAANGTWTDVN